MTTQKLIFLLTIILLSVAGILIYLAAGGEAWATGILFSLWSIFCLVLGSGIVIVINAQHAKQDQAKFQANMTENLQLMQQAQKVQNAQNQTLLQQVGQLSRFPPQGNGGFPPSSSFLIDDGIFDELDS